MTTRPVTQADVACAYRDGYADGHDDGTDHAAATTQGRIAELERDLAAARLALAAVRDVRAAGSAARATETRSDGTGAPE